MSKVDLSLLGGGQLQEMFDMSFAKVMKNLLDPNTSYKDKRSITITLNFSMDEERNKTKCEFSCKEKLAPTKKVETTFGIAKDLETGQIQAKEFTNLVQIAQN